MVVAVGGADAVGGVVDDLAEFVELGAAELGIVPSEAVVGGAGDADAR